jgi:hypothetical protein
MSAPANPPATPPAKGVVRIDGASTHGWQVRVYRGGKALSRLFSDTRHGGPDAAYAAAVAFRAEMEAAAPPPPPPARRLFSGNRLNQTGVTGVSRTVKRDARGRPHEVYSVTWSPEPGKSRSTSYSIRRWGEDTAFRLACQKRWAEMRAVHGERYPVPSYLDLYRQKAAVDARAEARSAAWDAERESTRKRPGPRRARR